MKIKNHEILHEISRGALTTVYKARHLNLDRPVLLKVLNRQWLDQRDLLERFRREARIAGSLRHPGIVSVYDFEILPDLVYISMEYVDGQTAADYVKSQQPIPFEKIKKIFLDLLTALVYAHNKGVIHRDIKPSNILLDKTFNARLTDFGLASLVDVPGVTEQGYSLGTPAYMAPEQIRGEKCDQQADLYSLGITIYELISGHSAYQKENTAATLHSVLSDDLPDPNSFRRDIPGEFAGIIAMLIQKEKKHRPESALHVIKLLEKQKKSNVARQKSRGVISKNKNISFWAIPGIIIIFLLFFYFQYQNKIPARDKSQNIQIGDSTVSGTDLFISEKKDTVYSPNSISSQQKEENEAKNSAIPDNETKNIIENSELNNESPAKMYIICNPWAVVKIDGDSIDTTPLKKQILLSEGRHIIELSNPNFKSVQREYEIKGGTSDTLYFQLEPAFGFLMVQVTPWAQLFINNNYPM